MFCFETWKIKQYLGCGMSSIGKVEYSDSPECVECWDRERDHDIFI